MWVAFNSAFDFGYLLKIVTSQPLPHSESDFLKSLEQYFPVFYDVKHLRMDEGDLNSQLRNESIVREGVAH
jgi:CCR4-NOT transcription complex subunit 7/8